MASQLSSLYELAAQKQKDTANEVSAVSDVSSILNSVNWHNKDEVMQFLDSLEKDLSYDYGVVDWKGVKYKGGKVFNGIQIILLKEALYNDIPVWYFAKPEYGPGTMISIMEILQSKLNYSVLDGRTFTAEHVELICKGLRHGLDVWQYADPNIPIDKVYAVFSSMWKTVEPPLGTVHID